MWCFVRYNRYQTEQDYVILNSQSQVGPLDQGKQWV